MTKTKNTSLRLLLSCGSEDIYCSASERSLDSTPSKEFQCPPLDIVNEALRAGKSTKQNESNGKTHQLNSSKEYKSEYVMEKGPDIISQEPATKREEAKMTRQTNTSMRLLNSCGSEDISSSSESSLNIPSTDFQRPPLCIVNEALRASKRTLPHFNSFKENKSDCALEGEENNEPGTTRASDDANARPALIEPLSRLTSSRGVLRPSLRRLWVSRTNIKVEGRPTIKESKQQHREGDEGSTGEEDCAAVGEEPESRNKFFQFSQLKTRSLRAASRLQVQAPWSSFRYLKIEETQHSMESQTSEEDASCPRLLTSSRQHESPVIEGTNPKRNLPSIGLGGGTAPSVVKASLDVEDGVHDDKVSRELAAEKKTESHIDPSSQPTLRSRGNRPKLQRRGSVTKFNLDHANNESFRRRRPRMERRCSVNRFSLGVNEAQAESATNCVFVAPKMSRPKLSRSGQATVLIFSKESLDLGNEEPKRNVIAPNAA
jgi:hypothetical protein